MKLFFHFVLSNFSNTYILGPEEGGNTILVDPGVMDIKLLNLLEENNFYVKHILVTHNHSSHVKGIKTIQKIYNADVYSNQPLPFKCSNNKKINDGDVLKLEKFIVNVFSTQGHSNDSMIFLVNNMLFTGDTIYSGCIDNDLTLSQNKTLKERVKNKIFTLDDNIMIFPGHGSPSTVRLEKEFNYSLRDCKDKT